MTYRDVTAGRVLSPDVNRAAASVSELETVRTRGRTGAYCAVKYPVRTGEVYRCAERGLRDIDAVTRAPSRIRSVVRGGRSFDGNERSTGCSRTESSGTV